MFLTTEPTLVGKNYTALQVICAAYNPTENLFVGDTFIHDTLGCYNENIKKALNELKVRATELKADGVIGVHLYPVIQDKSAIIMVMGTAIKFV